MSECVFCLQNLFRKISQILLTIFVFFLIFVPGCYSLQNIGECGIDQSSTGAVVEGIANIETYPWMGLLLYPFGAQVDKTHIATVVLVTKHIALSTALEIDKFPKHDFRRMSRVVFGHNSSQGPFIHVLEYSFHPEFSSQYYSTLAMLQLEMPIKQDLVPICQSPTRFLDLNIYAMTLNHDYSSSIVRIYKMKYIKENECRDYYRRNNLDIESMWPKHMACAQSLQGDKCLWRSGTVLAVKQEGKWHLLGIGVYGPGCGAPARFLSYDWYIIWVRDSLARTGRVAITRDRNNTLIVRKSLTKIQRYGACDDEERQYIFFKDHTEVAPFEGIKGTFNYNLTLYGKVDYTCIEISARYKEEFEPELLKPDIRITKWCFAKTVSCSAPSSSSMFFQITIKYTRAVEYDIISYAIPVKTVEAKQVLWWTNQRLYGLPNLWNVPIFTLHRGVLEVGPYPAKDSNAYPKYP